MCCLHTASATRDHWASHFSRCSLHRDDKNRCRAFYVIEIDYYFIPGATFFFSFGSCTHYSLANDWIRNENCKRATRNNISTHTGQQKRSNSQKWTWIIINGFSQFVTNAHTQLCRRMARIMRENCRSQNLQKEFTGTFYYYLTHIWIIIFAYKFLYIIFSMNFQSPFPLRSVFVFTTLRHRSQFVCYASKASYR